MNDLLKIGALKLSLYLKPRLKPEIFDNFHYVLLSDATTEQLENAISKCSTSSPIMLELLNNFSDNTIAITCLELALLEHTYPYILELFGIITPHCVNGISLDAAAKISYKTGINYSVELVSAYYLINKVLTKCNNTYEIGNINYYADTTLISLIQGVYSPNPALDRYVTYFHYEQELPANILWCNEIHDISHRINLLRSNDKPPVFHITGEELSGRRFFMKHLAKECKGDLLMVDYAYFKSDFSSQPMTAIDLIIRDIFLLKSALCIYNIDAEYENGTFNLSPLKNMLNELLVYYDILGLPLFLTSKNNINLKSQFQNPYIKFSLPKLSITQSITMWQELSKLNIGKCLPVFEQTAHTIILPAGKIEKIIKELILFQKTDITKQELCNLCYQTLDDGRYDNIKRVQSKYTFDDLKLEADKKELLKQICGHIEHKDIVYEKWNMSKLYPYGNCISILFTGASGTGKTMAAHVIANMVDLELYKVDLSKVMDKYIGETEKRLDDIFNRAENSNMILFFDEADAIFSKRSEISDAKDKYANTEVSYILQRIEEFNGIVILATNYKNNIDTAFMRRIKYVVDFCMPNMTTRKEIWKALFLDTMPYENIEFDYLAEQFEFTGAMIKNVVLLAAFKAVNENSPIQMHHIAQSILDEYKKIGGKHISEKLQIFLE